MRGLRHAVIVATCLGTLALACKPSADPAELEARSAAGDGQAETAPQQPGESPAVRPAAGTAPSDAGIDVAFVHPPGSCADQVEVLSECWTEKFPPDVSGSSDIACRVTLTCCGSIVQRWTRAYPQAAGASGVVLRETKPSTFQCAGTPALGLSDLDGDGTPNENDPNPLTPGTDKYPWQ